MAGVGIVPNVELLEVGEEWMASTGPFTCSAEDLADARAAFDDPTIPAPIIKLGHISKLNQGEPAFGRIINAALTDSDHTINGDLAGMPVWLANNLATLYPRRSIEGMRNYTAASGRTYKFVISAVALLGAQYPAVTSLKDIQLVMEAETPEELNLVAEADIAAADDDADTVKGPDMPLFGKKNKKVELSVAVDDVRRAFYDSLDAHEDYWLWIREIQIDPPQLIVTDERDESLHRVTYSIAGDEVTFGEPIAVEVIYQDKADVAASGDSGARIVYSTKDESRPAKDRSNDLLPTEVQPMTPDQLKAIGLEEDATKEQIDARLAELAEAAAKAATASDTPPAGDDDGKGGGEGGDAPAQTPPGSPPVTVPQGEGEGASTPKTVLVDASAWEDMQSFRQKAQARFEADEAREKDSLIAAAIADGKFTPAVKGDWRKALDTNYEATKATIDALPKGSVSLSEVGHGGTGEDIAASQADYAADYLTPAERARISSFYSGQEA